MFLSSTLLANSNFLFIESPKITLALFVSSINNLISLNRQHIIEVKAPLINMSKEQIIANGVRLGVKFEDTWTCYSNREDGLADATTPSSSLRIQGFIKAKYKDPIKYLQQDKLDGIYESNNCQEL